MRGGSGTSHPDRRARPGAKRPNASRAGLLAGERAEQAAARWLEQRGYRILARNVRCRAGELDLVACQGRLVVVAEVRARRANLGQSGQELAAASVTPAKRRRLVSASRWWLARQHHLQDRPVRFDVLTVTLDDQGNPAQIVHVPGAFEVSP